MSSLLNTTPPTFAPLSELDKHGGERRSSGPSGSGRRRNGGQPSLRRVWPPPRVGWSAETGAGAVASNPALRPTREAVGGGDGHVGWAWKGFERDEERPGLEGSWSAV